MGERKRERYGLSYLTNTLLFQTKLFSYKTLLLIIAFLSYSCTLVICLYSYIKIIAYLPCFPP